MTDDIRAMACEIAQPVGWAVLKPERYQELLTAWLRHEAPSTAHMRAWYYRRGPLGLPLTPEDFEGEGGRSADRPIAPSSAAGTMPAYISAFTPGEAMCFGTPDKLKGTGRRT